MPDSPLRALLIESSPEDAAAFEFLIADSRSAANRVTLKIANRLSTGLQKLSAEPFDVVLLSLHVSPEPWQEALARLHGHKPDLPIVLLCGPLEEAVAQNALHLGAQDYLLRGSFDCRCLAKVLCAAVARGRIAGQFRRMLMDDRCARVVLDRQGIIRFANAAADRLLGKRPGDLLGKPFPMELPAEGPAAIRIDMHHSGRRTAVVSAAPIEWNDGPARLVTLTDDTDLRELDRLKADLSARLVETEAKDQLINGISHEMRNPLTIIKTALYALRGRLAGPLTPQQDKFLDMATRNIDRQIRMVENVLDLGHLRSGRLQIEFGRVDLIALIAQLTEEFQLVNPTVRLELEMPKQLPPARAESELVAQVLRNLLDNAVRFARSKVTLKATGAEDQVLISVVDDGVGIPKEHLDEIFHQYVQLHRPSGRGYKGTGLGLAICREIVERHGGRIWVESVFGMGSRFHFTLLLADASVTDSSNIIHPSAMVGPGSGGYNQSL